MGQLVDSSIRLLPDNEKKKKKISFIYLYHSNWQREYVNERRWPLSVYVTPSVNVQRKEASVVNVIKPLFTRGVAVIYVTIRQSPPCLPGQCELDLLLNSQTPLLWHGFNRSSAAGFGRQSQSGIVQWEKGVRSGGNGWLQEHLIHLHANLTESSFI